MNVVISSPGVPITITNSDPANGAVNVLVNKIITITFNQPIKAGSAYNNIQMVNVNDNSVKDVTTSISGNVLTITPTYNWLQKVTYRLTIPISGISDLLGNGLTTPFTTSFTSNFVPTSIVVNPSNGFSGDNVNLVATLKDTNNLPLSGKTIQFSVDGNIVGQSITEASGTAAYVYTIIQNSGTYTVLAEFLQDDIYASSNNTNNLVVNHTPTALVVNPVGGFKGDNVNLIATLTDTHSNLPLIGKTIQFSVDGNIIGHAVTDTSGTAAYVYTS